MQSTVSAAAALICAIILQSIEFRDVTGSHFRGGLMHWKIVEPFDVDRVTVRISQRYAYKLTYSTDTYCDDVTIASHQLCGEIGSLQCTTNCPVGGMILGGVQVYCTDYSVVRDWMIGERTYDVVLCDGSGYNPFPTTEASFSSRSWILSLVVGGGTDWELRIKFNLAAIRATGRPAWNRSPRTLMSPVVNLVFGCNNTLVIPIVDEDGDTVRCRWASAALGECGGVCGAFTGATIDANTCTIRYDNVNQRGMYAVAVQIEDFLHPTDTDPLSSVPLQFLANVDGYRACSDRPSVSDGGRCIQISANATFTDRIIATASNPTFPVVDITTQSPSGTTKSAINPGPNPNQWYVDISWTPDIPEQLGTSLICFSATDSGSAESDQHCWTLVVVDSAAAQSGFGSAAEGSCSGANEVSTTDTAGRLTTVPVQTSSAAVLQSTVISRSTFSPLTSSPTRDTTSLANVVSTTNTAVRLTTVPIQTSSAAVLQSTVTSRSTFSPLTSSPTRDTTSLANSRASTQQSTSDSRHPQATTTATVFPDGFTDSPSWTIDSPPMLTFHQKPSCFCGIAAPVPSVCEYGGRQRHDLPFSCLIESPDLLLSIGCNFSVSLTSLPVGFHALRVQVNDGVFDVIDGVDVRLPVVDDRMTADDRMASLWSVWTRCTGRSGRVGIQQRYRSCALDGVAKQCSRDATNIRFCRVDSCSASGLPSGDPTSRTEDWIQCVETHQFTVPIHKLRHLLTESRSSTSLPPAAGHNATSEDTATGSATLLTHSDCLWLAIVIAVCTCIVLLVTAVGALAFAAYFCYTCKTTEQIHPEPLDVATGVSLDSFRWLHH